MSQMDDLINTMTAYYGVTFTLVIIATVMILAIITVLLPLFVWSIHNQTTRATKELIKLNKLIEGLIPKQQPKDRLKEQSSEDRQFEKIIKESQIEPLFKDRLPEPAYRRKKVFYKPDDKLPDQKKKSS
jgi:predicted PurR-regulated permease PerM